MLRIIEETGQSKPMDEIGQPKFTIETDQSVLTSEMD